MQKGLPSAVTGFCFWLLEQRIKKRDDEQKEAELKRQKKSDERDAQRKEYEICQLNMTAASMALAEATAQAVQRIPDAHCNGDMHKALDYAAKVLVVIPYRTQQNVRHAFWSCRQLAW